MQSLFLFPRQFLSVKGTFQTQTSVCFGFLSSGCCLKQTLLWRPSLQKNKMFHILSPTVVPSIHRTSKNPVNTRFPRGQMKLCLINPYCLTIQEMPILRAFSNRHKSGVPSIFYRTNIRFLTKIGNSLHFTHIFTPKIGFCLHFEQFSNICSVIKNICSP